MTRRQQRHNAGKPKLSYVFSNAKAMWMLQNYGIDYGNQPEGAAHILVLMNGFLSRENSAGALLSCLTEIVKLLQAEMGGPVIQPCVSHVEYVFSHVEAWDEYCRVCEVGAAKYSRGNYRLGESWTHYADCALRHTRKFMCGIQLDEESGCHHLAHALWNLWQLMDQPEWRDDRLPAVNRNEPSE